MYITNVYFFSTLFNFVKTRKAVNSSVSRHEKCIENKLFCSRYTPMNPSTVVREAHYDISQGDIRNTRTDKSYKNHLINRSF